MPIGMNLLLWTPAVTEAHFPLLESLKTCGYDGVELPLFEIDLPTLRRVASELDRLELRRTGVTVATHVANPISPDARVRRAAVEQLRRHLDACAEAGIELLCGPFHSTLGALSGRGRTAEEWSWCVETLREAALHAAEVGVALSVEPLNRFEVYFLNTIADAARLSLEINVPGFGCLYDTFHANIEEFDIASSLREALPQVNHVHISENHRGTPGSGHVHWETTFRELREGGYDGWLTIEAFGRAIPEVAAATCIWRDLFDSPEQLCRDGLAFIHRMLGR